MRIINYQAKSIDLTILGSQKQQNHVLLTLVSLGMVFSVIVSKPHYRPILSTLNKSVVALKNELKSRFPSNTNFQLFNPTTFIGSWIAQFKGVSVAHYTENIAAFP